MKNFFLVVILNLILFSCARVGSPVGGKKDTIPPKFIGANIDTSRVNVSKDLHELRLYFDEYVTLKDASKNITISPVIKKITRIIPSTIANKFISIQWKDTLQANTTYSFNFGNAIRDNNEGNVLPYFTYAFSTGKKIDNLYISGEVKDGLSTKTKNADGKEKEILVGLYKDSDSIDYRKKPYYIARADEDGYYELNYLSPGDYKIIAFEDTNQNSIYDPAKENVGFAKEPVHLEKSISGLNLKVFPSKKPFKFKESKDIEGGILFLFQGNPEKVEIAPLGKPKEFKVLHKPKSDSVTMWFNAVKEEMGTKTSEQLKFICHTGSKNDTIPVYYRANPKAQLTLSAGQGNIVTPKQSFKINANMPVSEVQYQKWTLESDSIKQDFKAKISETHPQVLEISADFKEGKKYQLTVPKETLSSYFYTTVKSYRFDFEIDKSLNYGIFTLKLENTSKNKRWIQLLDDKESVVYSIFTADTEIKFTELKPGTYNLRILEDNDGNGYWDESDFVNSKFAEDVFYFPKKIEIRPMWDIPKTWDLKTNNEVPTVPPKE